MTDLKTFASLPRHVAIIMDGNNRWAKARRLPSLAGHKAGVDAVRAVVDGCVRYGIESLTLFAFSSENWRRPPAEVAGLMELFMLALKSKVKKLHKNNIRLVVIGDKSHKEGELEIDALTEELLAAQLSLAGQPLPDLCIRTGGERRISNFLLWQFAYAEFYFSSDYWPDFDRAALEAAFDDFSQRQRRFGKTSEQVEAEEIA